jgi:phage terminase small subunit
MSEQLTFEQALEKLTGKQRAFVLAYLDCLNAAEAARQAGYAARSLYQTASENLRKPDIKDALRLGFERKAMQKDEVIARISAIASASLEDFITLEAEAGADDSTFPDYGQPETPEGGEGKPRTPHPGHWRLDLAKAKRRGVLGALKKLKWGEHGPEIELYSALEAQQLLGKYHRAFVERQEVSGPNGAPLQITTEDKARAEADLAEWRRQQQEALKQSNG